MKAVLAGFAAAACISVLAVPAAADDVYNIKMSTQLSEGSPFVDGFYAGKRCSFSRLYPSALLIFLLSTEVYI